MKILFLDFDGVLNSEQYVKNHNNFGVVIDPERMFMLKQIIDSTGAKIVLTTSWREHWNKDISQCDNIGLEINRIFAEYSLTIYDKTPVISHCREDEIEMWLNNHTDVVNFVAIDDRFLDSKLIRNRFVKTNNYKYGIDENSVKEAVDILTREENI